MKYLAGYGGSEGEHVSEWWDDVDCEADEQRTHSRVDGPKEGEDDSEEPYGDHHRQPRRRPLAQAAAVVEADGLLPHEVQRRAREPEGDELVDEH